MSYGDDRMNEVDQEISQLEDMRRNLRSRERGLRARAQYLEQPNQFAMNNIKALKDSLRMSLPPYMMPSNIGGINEVAWPFYFQIDFDIGTNATLSTATFFKQSFFVDQEAGLILLSISRDSTSLDTGVASATQKAPLQIELIDRSSSRRFNNAPIPIQMVGFNSNPMILPTGMYLQPSAFLDVQLSSSNPVAQTLVGQGNLQFSFFGLRVRAQDAGKVLSTIFGI